MSADYWKQQIKLMEQSVIRIIPPDLEHVDDGKTRDYDAQFIADYVTTNELPVVGQTMVEAGTAAELKTCQIWIDDSGSNGGRRRGRWFIQQDAHEALREADGVYLLVVTRDEEEVVDGRVVPPHALDGLLSWTNGGNRYNTPRAYVPWSKVISPESVSFDDG